MITSINYLTLVAMMLRLQMYTATLTLLRQVSVSKCPLFEGCSSNQLSTVISKLPVIIRVVVAVGRVAVDSCRGHTNSYYSPCRWTQEGFDRSRAPQHLRQSIIVPKETMTQ